MKPALIIYWSRRDFRLHDNPALHTAIQQSDTEGIPLLPLFIIEDYMRAADFPLPQRMFLSEALPAFAKHVANFTVVQHKAVRYFTTLAHHFSLTIHANEDIHPLFFKQVQKIKDAGISITVHRDRLTASKETVTGAGDLYSIFTPFKRAVWNECLAVQPVAKSIPEKATMLSTVIIKQLSHTVDCEKAALWSLFSHKRTMTFNNKTIDLFWQTIPSTDSWYTTEAEALSHCTHFITSGKLYNYKDGRDSLEKDAEGNGQTSHLSIGLAWGLISMRTVMEILRKHVTSEDLETNEHVTSFISELIWREFYGYLLFHKPQLLHEEFQKKFRNTIQWVTGHTAGQRMDAWMRGETGYPIVDAAMQQLAQTGIMHNRTRMIVASVLTKNFGVDWRFGQAYFQATLIDLDEASNNGGWQWGASVGADPKPIRIFNPLLQAKTHDASGAYQNKWLPATYFLGGPATHPVIEHADARAEALARYGLEPRAGVRDY